MSRLDRLFEVVTEHNVAVVVVMLLLTAGVAAGITGLNTTGGGANEPIGQDTEVVQAQEYVATAYANTSENAAGAGPRPTAVYVQATDGGNALSKAALVESLAYQERALENASVATALGDRPVLGVANLVAARLSGASTATVSERRATLEAASPEAVREAVRTVLAPGSQALALLPTSYEPGTATAESHRMLFRLADGGGSPAGAALYETARAVDAAGVDVYTVGGFAAATAVDPLPELIEFVVPISLLVILAVLAFVYRDVLDVVVGFTGVVVSVLWMFGILGWLNVPAGLTLIIGPVLIVGLSVDYGLHVFMRHREARGAADPVRPPMVRSLASVAVALALVTLTAAVGFLANAVSPVAIIRQLGYGVTLGVLSTFVVSLTLVPALKVTADDLLERLGRDRHATPLGHTPRLTPVLEAGAGLARRAAPVVLLVAVVVGAAGGVAWGELERKSFQQNDIDVAEWKQDLPEPVGWEVSAYGEHSRYVESAYVAAADDDRRRSTILIEPPDGADAASPAVLDAVARVTERARAEPAVVDPSGTAVRSPLSVLADVAATNETVADRLAAADTDGDGVPERDVAGVLDALFGAAPDRAARVIDRTDDGYRSVRVLVPIGPDVSFPAEGRATLDVAAAVEADLEAEATGVSVVAAGPGAASVVVGDILSASILETMLLALAGVTVLLVVVYRLLRGSATLGLVTSVPIGMVTALVVAGMWALGVPLTVNTALLLSLVIGLGIDYNIHVSDRFIEEYAVDGDLDRALRAATTGTGGALLGSTLTSVGAFLALLLTPVALLQDFGALVTLALGASLLVSVYLLPSLLALWVRYAPAGATDVGSTPATGD